MNEATEIHALALAERKQSKTTLYELETELQALLDTGEDLTEENWSEFTTLLYEQLPRNVSKRERVGQFIRHCELQADNRKAEIERLQAGQKFYRHVAARARASLEYVLRALGRDEKGKWPKLEGHTVTLSLRNNPVAVTVTDEDAVPPQYKRFHLQVWGDTWGEILAALPAPLHQRVLEEINERKIDTEISKTRIKQAISEGQDVPGADLEESQSVVIR